MSAAKTFFFSRLVLLLLCGLGFWALSCGASPDKQAQRRLDLLRPDGQELVLWYQGGAAAEAFWKRLAAEFNAVNPWGIRVREHRKSPFESIWPLPQAGGRDAGPDLLFLLPSAGTALPQPGDAVDLFPYCEHKEWGGRAFFSKKDWKRLRRETWQDYLVKEENWTLPGFPVLRDPPVLYVNKNLRERLETQEGAIGGNGEGIAREIETLSGLWKLCQASARHLSRPGLILYPHAGTLTALACAAAGGQKYKDFPDLPETLEKERENLAVLHREGCVRTAENLLEPQMDFSAGDYLFSLGSLSALPSYRATIKAAGEKFDWGVVSFPGKNRKTMRPSLDYLFYLLPSGDERQLAGWLFIRWCLSPAVQAEMAQAMTVLPVNFQALPVLQTADGLSRQFREFLFLPEPGPLGPYPWARSDAASLARRGGQ